MKKLIVLFAIVGLLLLMMLFTFPVAARPFTVTMPLTVSLSDQMNLAPCGAIVPTSMVMATNGMNILVGRNILVLPTAAEANHQTFLSEAQIQTITLDANYLSYLGRSIFLSSENLTFTLKDGSMVQITSASPLYLSPVADAINPNLATMERGSVYNTPYRLTNTHIMVQESIVTSVDIAIIGVILRL